MAAGSIVIDLLMKTGSFETDTKRAEKALQNLKKEAISAGKTIGIGFAAVGAAVSVFVKQQIDAADQMGEMAEKVGIATESLSALSYAAEMSGATQDDMAAAIAKLSRQMVEAAAGNMAAKEAFDAVGVSVTDASGRLKNADDVFREIADRFAAMPNGVEKTAAAIDLFGKSGANLVPTLNRGSAGLREMADEARQLGVLINDDLASAAGQFNDNIDKLQKLLSGLGLTIANSVIPYLNEMLDQFFVGQKHANGLFDAIVKFGTINPFKTNTENLKSYREELDGLYKDRQRYLNANSDTRAIDDAIKNLQSKINYLSDLERRAQAANVSYSPDDQSTAEARRLGIIPKTRVPPAPTVKTPSVKLPKMEFDREFYKDVPMAADEQARFDAIAKRKNMLEGEKKAIEEYNRVLQEGADIYEATRTPLEKLNAEEARLTELLQQGAIDWDTYSRAVMQANDAYTASTEKLKETTDEMDQFAKKAAENIQDQLGSGLYDIMQGNFKNIGSSFKQMLDRMVAEALAAQLARKMFGGLVEGGTGGGWFGDAFKAVGGILNFGGAKAGGGDVIASRPYLVGENGPEMFVPRTAGSILPNQDTAPAQRQGSTIVVNMQANPQMSRDAALQQGQRVAQGLQLAMLRNG